MRVTTVFKRVLRLDDVNVMAVEWFARLIVVTVCCAADARGRALRVDHRWPAAAALKGEA